MIVMVTPLQNVGRRRVFENVNHIADHESGTGEGDERRVFLHFDDEREPEEVVPARQDIQVIG